MKPKKCKACAEVFQPARPMQKACSPSCALSIVKAAQAKAERKQDKVKREKLKSLSELASEAQEKVNAYVRYRDWNDGCISCDKPASWDGQWHASHFRSRGAASSLRFHLWNIHKACSQCNNMKAGNLHDYIPALIEKIGADRVEWLYAQNEVRKYGREYLARMKRVFAKKAARQKKRIERV